VLSREFTGVGSFTRFGSESSQRDPELGDQQLGLDGIIVVPSVPNGMGAVLVCTDGRPTMLETFTYGDELWDGTFANFSIQQPDG
jgi:hypothetical protein